MASLCKEQVAIKSRFTSPNAGSSSCIFILAANFVIGTIQVRVLGFIQFKALLSLEMISM